MKLKNKCLVSNYFDRVEVIIESKGELKETSLRHSIAQLYTSKSKLNVGSENVLEENHKLWISTEKRVCYGCKLASVYKMLTVQNSLPLGLATSCRVGLFITLQMEKLKDTSIQ